MNGVVELKPLLERLARISPKWTAVIRTMEEGDSDKAYDMIIRDRLNIEDNCRCVVGEAHKFKDNYAFVEQPFSDRSWLCSICDTLSVDIMPVVDMDANIKNYAKSCKALQKFIEHFEEVHVPHG